jgi:hypothetical protein
MISNIFVSRNPRFRCPVLLGAAWSSIDYILASACIVLKKILLKNSFLDSTLACILDAGNLFRLPLPLTTLGSETSPPLICVKDELTLTITPLVELAMLFFLS